MGVRARHGRRREARSGADSRVLRLWVSPAYARLSKRRLTPMALGSAAGGTCVSGWA